MFHFSLTHQMCLHANYSYPGRVILTLSTSTFCTNYSLEIEWTEFKEKSGL